MASDKDIEGWLNDHTGSVQAPSPAAKAPADGDIESWLNDSTQPQQMSGQLPLRQAASQVIGSAIGDPSTFNKPVSASTGNPIKDSLMKLAQPFAGMIGPSRLSATISQPGQLAGQNVTNSLNDLNQNLTGTPPSKPAAIANKLIGTGVGATLDPQSYVPGAEEVTPIAQGAVDSVAKTALDKVIAPMGEILSGTKQRTIKQLFNNPIETITAMSSKEAGDVLGTVYKQLGFTDDDMRLIAKAADRGSGGSQTVYDQVIGKIKDSPDEVTLPELVAARRAASKLSTVRGGMEKAIVSKDIGTFNNLMSQVDPQGSTQILSAISDVAQGKTKEAFLNLFPLNKNMSANALRGIFGLAAAASGHPAAMLAESPLTTGLGTLAASAGYNATRAVVGNPPARVTGLQVLRNFINQQRTNGPASQ